MEQPRMARTAVFLMFTMLVSRLLGYVRVMVMANIFGQGGVTDAYTAAFLIPDLIYNVLVGGAISAAFIPVFSSYIAKKQEDEAWRVFSIATTWVMTIMLAAITAAYIFTPQLMNLLVPGFSPENLELVVFLTRIMLLQPFFMALSGLSMGVLHSHQIFTAPAVGLLFYNLLIVLCGFFLAKPLEANFPGYGIAGFSIGVVAGSLLYFVAQIPALRRVHLRYRPSWSLDHPGFRRLIALMIPALITFSVSYVNQLINTILASGLNDGAITALSNAQKFINLPTGVFAASIAMTIFPSMTQHAALHELDDFKKLVSYGIRMVVYICLPAAVGLMALGEPVVRLLFEHGQFTAADTVITGEAIDFYALGLTFTGVCMVLMRCFYALQKNKLTVYVSIFSVVVSVVFSLLLVGPLEHKGLALAYSISMLAQCSLYFFLLRRKIGPMDFRHILKSFFQTALGCLVMYLGLRGLLALTGRVLDLTAKTGQTIELVICLGAGVLLYFCATYFMGMEESRDLTGILKRRFKRGKAA